MLSLTPTPMKEKGSSTAPQQASIQAVRRLSCTQKPRSKRLSQEHWAHLCHPSPSLVFMLVTTHR